MWICQLGLESGALSGGGRDSLTNMPIHNVADAKAHLSQLLDAALKGEDVGRAYR